MTDPARSPFEELRAAAAEVIAWRDVTAARLTALTEATGRYRTDAAEVRAEVLSWERALDCCTAVLTKIARLNMEDRLRRLGCSPGDGTA